MFLQKAPFQYGFRRSKLAAFVALTSVAFSSQAIAQDTADEVVEESEVTVTGSRIVSDNQTSPVALNVVDSEAISVSGAINASEILDTLPASGISTFTSTNSNFDTNNSGVNTVELRNLGEDRTLVLINGRRMVAGVPGTQAVDFNSIPTEFIERIEVVTGGASAVYGSDALAGVVNVILKDDFEGLHISGQGGRSDEGDDETYRLSATGGFTFSEDRGSAMASVTWDKENGVFARDRPNLGLDGANSVFFTGDPNDYDNAVVPFFSSFSERGRIIVPDAEEDFVVDDGNVRPFVSAQDGFNRQAFRALSTPTERLQISTLLDFELNDNTTWFMETMYSSVQTASRLEPFPLSSEDIYGDNLPDCFDTDGDGVNDDCNYGIAITNPLVPEGIRDQARAANPDVDDEDLVVGFARRTTELGARGADNLRQTFRAVTGIEGSLFEDYNYEVSLNYGRTTQDQKSGGQINVLNMRYALDAIEDPETGDIVCRDEIARLQGCVPVNIFGLGAITDGLSSDETDAVRRYLQANSSRTAQVEQTNFLATFGGPLVELNGNDVQFNVGYEYRYENSEAIADGLSQQGLNAGNISPPTTGSYNVNEVFGEVYVPILEGVPGAQILDATLSARFSDYSTVGNTSAYGVSVNYKPIEDILVRSNFAVAVRAPNISELFSPLSETFEGGDDPCEGVTRSGADAAFLNETRNPDDRAAALGSGVNAETVGSAVAEACLQDPLVAQRVDDEGGLVLTQAEIQGVGGFNGGAASGDVELEEEEAKTFTIGTTWNPTFVDFLEPLTFSVDYFNIEIEEGIATIGRQDSLDNCYDNSNYDADSAFCSNIVRVASGPSVGSLDELNALTQNLAEIETSGYDFQVGYDLNLDTLGDLRADLTYTRLLSYSNIPFEGAERINSKGEVGLAKHKAVLGLIHRWENLTTALSTRYFSSSELSNDSTNAFFGASVGSKFFTDLQVRYDLLDNAELYVGVDNISNTFVRIEQFGPGVPTGWNTVPDVYDALGRRYYAGFRLKF